MRQNQPMYISHATPIKNGITPSITHTTLHQLRRQGCQTYFHAQVNFEPHTIPALQLEGMNIVYLLILKLKFQISCLLYFPACVSHYIPG